MHYEYKKYKILFADDEVKACKYFTKAFEDIFDIITCKDGSEAVSALQEHGDEIGIIVTDQRMPEMTGVELLDYANKEVPNAIRILSTAYSDLNSAVDAVNRGQIYKYITKPWDIAGLEAILRRAMEYFLIKQEREELLSSKLSSLQRILAISRVTTVAVAPAIKKMDLKHGEATFYSLLRLGLSVSDQIDLGLDDLLSSAHQLSGFYESYKQNNQARLDAMLDFTLPGVSLGEAKSQVASLLGGELNGDQVVNLDEELLHGLIEEVFGFAQRPDRLERLNVVLPLLILIGEEGHVLQREANCFHFMPQKETDSALALFLDDEIVLSSLGKV